MFFVNLSTPEKSFKWHYDALLSPQNSAWITPQTIATLGNHINFVLPNSIRQHTLLIEAVFRGRMLIVKYLIDVGANINYQLPKNYEDKEIPVNKKGWSALHFAAYLNLSEITKILVAAGADTELESETGLTAMNIANQKSSIAVINYLNNPATREVIKIIRRQQFKSAHDLQMANRQLTPQLPVAKDEMVPTDLQRVPLFKTQTQLQRRIVPLYTTHQPVQTTFTFFAEPLPPAPEVSLQLNPSYKPPSVEHGANRGYANFRPSG